jgi:lipopolysaccharide/colanic/teichoic acid biosynthesis glycosyltransferase
MTLSIKVSELSGNVALSADGSRVLPRHNPGFWVSKRFMDIIMAVMLLPVATIAAMLLLLFNPLINRGPLLYRQIRMGKDCKPFWALKFRTMRQSVRQRGPDDPIESYRITYGGLFLRRTRLDELPQIWNVLRGEMSMIGPRPDYFSHAKYYLRTVPEYRARHVVRPGISGLAQIQLGYAEGIEAARNKAATDLQYIQNAGFRMDLWIIWRTITTVFFCKGA